MVASSSRPRKRSTSSRREVDPFGWFSDEDQRTSFICQRGYKEVIRHKCLSISFFRSEGFLFQEWLEKAGLTKFVELNGDCYLNLVRSSIQILKRKIAKQKEYNLPYGVFISKILRMQNVDITNERTICYNKKNVLEKLFLDFVGFRKVKEGWIFKDEYIPSTKEMNPLNMIHQDMNFDLKQDLKNLWMKDSKDLTRK
ncbi:hypothetical protein LR48_Vigan10g136900 [Vigna angularis]|uniref:Uncharacterized protein n=1 Tax=Phaseolus angularis TaxID=3914 RepID=A0A0L9VKR7_PHAAN|nr:hypothetical protein LR48_Vigan10g136900 [Vigna angularis]